MTRSQSSKPITTGFGVIDEWIFVGKMLDLLKKLAPTIEHVALMYDASSPPPTAGTPARCGPHNYGTSSPAGCLTT